MSDDGAAKQLLLNLASADKLSDKRLLDEFGFDYDNEIQNQTDELKRSMELAVERQKREAEAQGEASIILAQYNAEAQYQTQLNQIKIRAELFQDEIEAEFGSLPMEPVKIIEQYAMKVSYLSPEEQTAFLFELEQTRPITHSLLMQRLSQLEQLRLTSAQDARTAQQQGSSAAAAGVSEDSKEKGTGGEKKLNTTSTTKAGTPAG